MGAKTPETFFVMGGTSLSSWGLAPIGISD